ncbi:MAG: hypothetical protein WC635_10515 [Bacteriovorax sp.]|jgi:hypothetical protein
MNKLVLILLILTLSGCGNKAHRTGSRSKPPGLPANLELGTSTTEEIKNEMGEPTVTYAVMGEATVINYKDNRAFKLDQGVAKGFFRDPTKEESSLQYWLQKWKDKRTKQETIQESRNAHGQFDYQLICEEDNTTIIYNNENGVVKRVMYYEK